MLITLLQEGGEMKVGGVRLDAHTAQFSSFSHFTSIQSHANACVKKGLIHSAGEKKVSIMTTLENLSICPQSEDGKKMYAFPSREFSSSHQTLSRNLINNHRISVGTGLAGRNLMIKGDAATKKK